MDKYFNRAIMKMKEEEMIPTIAIVIWFGCGLVSFVLSVYENFVRIPRTGFVKKWNIGPVVDTIFGFFSNVVLGPISLLFYWSRL
jgi:hypothetical protein